MQVATARFMYNDKNVVTAGGSDATLILWDVIDDQTNKRFMEKKKTAVCKPVAVTERTEYHEMIIRVLSYSPTMILHELLWQLTSN